MRLFAAVSSAVLPPQATALEPPEVFQVAARSVVVVAAFGNQNKQGSGVALSPGVIVTNCHVVKDAARIEVWGRTSIHLPGTLLRKDMAHDLCLVGVIGSDAIPANVNYGALPRTGERVFAIGSPRGLELTISEGLVSGLRQTASGELVQTTAPISPGSSGGGLFNQNGDLVGLTTLTLTGAQNVNFAVPATRIKASFGSDFAALLARAPPTHYEKDEALRDSVASALSSGISGIALPQLKFDSLADRLAYLRWLGANNDRLKRFDTELTHRVEFLRTIFYEARRSGLEPALLLGLVETTSGFKQYSVNKANARGYMLVGPQWPQRIGDGDPARLFHMQTNIRFGCVLLRYYLDLEHGNLFLALERYGNQTRGATEPVGQSPTGFAAKVFAARRHWETE